MLKKLFLCIIFIFMILSITTFVKAADQVIVFEDTAMYQKVKSELDRQQIPYISYNDTDKSLTMTSSNINRVDLLKIENNNITNLKGIENFTSLWHLYANNNKITDISPLKDLTSLNTILLSNNNINNISSLEKLVNVTELQLDNNKISDVNVLSNLKNINRVMLANNYISDISFVEDLASLSLLVLSNNTFNITLPDLNKNENKTIELPSIFKYAKVQGSPVYTSENFTLNNCTIDGDNIVLNTSNTGNIVAKIVINGGNAKETTYTMNYVVNSDGTEYETNLKEFITNETPKNNTVAPNKLPQTGTQNLIFGILTIFVIAIISFVCYKKYNL